MSLPSPPLFFGLVAAVLAISAAPADARPHHRARLHHRYHVTRGGQATAPLTAGSSSIRINSVGEVIGPDPDRSR